MSKTFEYYSQENQDRYLNEQVFKGFKDGFYVDVGAHDGININNTYFFEKHLDWEGICIEPLPEIFSQLQTNRPNSTNINKAICLFEGNVDFYKNSGYTEMLSGIASTYDKRHKERLNYENNVMGSSTEIISVKSTKLSTVLKNINHVHYLSIDVEGAEFHVIQSIDFDKCFIDVIGYENNYENTGQVIKRYLESKGYEKLNYTGLDCMMIHKDSQFNKVGALINN
jgi:FkbM family methyltransferase